MEPVSGRTYPCADGSGLMHYAENVYQCAVCLRSHYDKRMQEIAKFELDYRNMGLRFFTVPVELRATVFPNGLQEKVETAILGNGGAPLIGFMLEVRRIELERIGDLLRGGQIESAGEKLSPSGLLDTWGIAGGLYMSELADRAFKTRTNVTSGRVVWLPLQGFDGHPDAGLPTVEADHPQKYREFRLWADWNREVSTAMRLGATKDEAIDELISDANRMFAQDEAIGELLSYVDRVVADDDSLTREDHDRAYELSEGRETGVNFHWNLPASSQANEHENDAHADDGTHTS